jgi:hypothetical protein
MNRYRINLYRERESAERRYRRGLAGASVLGVAVGLEVVLIGLLVVSGRFLGERADTLRAAVAALELESAPPQTGPAVDLARQLVQLRTSRIDWAQVLGGVSESIPGEVVLTRVSADLKLEGGTDPGLDLEGRTGGAAVELNPVLRFVDALRANPRVAAALPAVDLETVESERTKSFRVICRRPGATPETPETAEGSP